MEIKRCWYHPFSFSREMLNVPYNIKMISVVIFFYYLGWGIVSPFLPLYYKTILGSYTAVGLVTALLPLFALLIDIPAGGIINRVSKVWVLRIALLLYLPFSFFLLSLKNIFHFVLFRIYHSSVSTPFWISADSYARGNAQKWKAAESMSVYDVGATLSLVIGPIIGGILFVYFDFSLLYAISIFAGIALIASFFLKDSEKHETAKEAVKNLIFSDGVYKRAIVDFLQNKLLVKVYSFVFLFRFCMSFVVMLLPLFLKEFGASNFQIGLVFGLYYLPLLFEPYFSVYAKNKRLMTMGLLLCAVLFVSLFVNNRLSFIFFHAILLSLLFAAIIPMLNGRIVELMPKEQMGELSGVGMMFMHVADFAGPIIAGVVSDAFGLSYMFLVGAMVAFGLVMLSLRKSFRTALFD
ncbi:MAG: MFS transporter [Candidatus Nanoarchaeia archaeon]|nr:MFS transporter [Candidatus Nanoarchaeia archaeon]